MSLMLILIFSLVFASVALVSWQFYPVGAQVVGAYHAKKVKRDTRKLDKMFLHVSKKRLLLVYVCSPLAAGIVGLILTQNLMVGALACVVGIILPTSVLKIMDKRRTAKFCRQLVDGLMVLSSSLKGGLSLLQSMEVLVQEMPAPISQEFALVLRENKMGVSLNESLERLNRRIKSEELNLIITAIDIARETGGNLTEPFEKLMFSIRERDKLQGKVKTLTLQAKLQGIIMSLMPIVFGVVIYFLNPGFMKIMFEDKIGQISLGIALMLEVIGTFLLWKLSKVEV